MTLFFLLFYKISYYFVIFSNYFVVFRVFTLMIFIRLLYESLPPFVFNGLRDFFGGDFGIMAEILVVEIGGVERLVLVGLWVVAGE